MFNSIAIVGLGLIGGSLAKAIKQFDPNISIAAFDREQVLTHAIESKVIDIKLSNSSEALKCDLIIICLPIREALKVFHELAPNLEENQILTDVCSVKNVFSELWNNYESKGKYIGGHPMTGKEVGGYENSDPLLFENTIYIVTEDLTTSSELKMFKDLIHGLGANILNVPAHQHDVIAASVSHLPQLVSLALVNTSSLKTDSYNFLDLAAGGFRDMTRIASSDFVIWESIIKENRQEIITAIEKFTFEMEKIKSMLETEKYSLLDDYFEEAHKNREEIPLNTKGFINPLHDVYIFVKDEPGVISKISTALFEKNINIKDIELLKIREGSGGTFRVSFETLEDSKNAKVILNKAGFRTD
jgi:prephenate dehydrogenase